MTTFRIVSGLGFLAIAGLIAFDLRRRLGAWAVVASFIHAEWKRIRSFTRSPLKPGGRLLYLTTLLFFIVLAISGFSSIIFLGEHLTGTLLIIHVTVAPLFALSLSGLAILWANRLRIDLPPHDGRRADDVREHLMNGETAWFWLKLTFWSILVLSLPLLLSIILGMFPLFGADGEEILIDVHGYSALILSWVVLFQIFVLLTGLKRTTEYIHKEEQ